MWLKIIQNALDILHIAIEVTEKKKRWPSTYEWKGKTSGGSGAVQGGGSL